MKTFYTIELLNNGFLVRATQQHPNHEYHFSVEKGNKILYTNTGYLSSKLCENDLNEFFNEFKEWNIDIYNMFKGDV